jgi:O-antigen/teichoic acid export membrane protein
MPNLSTAIVLERSVHGVVALLFRSAFLKAVNLVSQFVLTIFLAPNEFGVYYIVLAVKAFLSYFSDIGLSAALIQKKEEATRDDFKTSFTIQQILVITIVIIGLLGSNFVASFYDLDRPGVFLFQALVFSLLLSSLKTIPSIILERELDFKKLIIPQIIEAIIFNVVAVSLAVTGHGISSFTFAVLTSGIAGLIAIYIISPWKPAFGIEKESARKLLSFGLPFQTNSILALLKDDFLTIILGRILTLSEVGYIGFAQKWAYTPLRLVLDDVIRITFPTFSRLQHDGKAMKIAIEKSLFIILTIVTPLLIGLVILAPYLIDLIPRYEKWEPAFVSLIFFSGNAMLSSISTPLTNFLNAVGKIRTTLKFMTFWTIATWILTLIGIRMYGFNGVAIAAFAVSISVVAVIIITRRIIAFDVFKSISAPIISGTIMAIALYFVSSLFNGTFLHIAGLVILGAVLYITILIILAKKELKRDIAVIKQVLKKG